MRCCPQKKNGKAAASAKKGKGKKGADDDEEDGDGEEYDGSDDPDSDTLCELLEHDDKVSYLARTSRFLLVGWDDWLIVAIAALWLVAACAD